MRPLRSLLASLLIAACAGLGCAGAADARGPKDAVDADPDALAAPASASPRTAVPLHVLLVAVGDEQPVFDRFVADLAQRFGALDVASLATASSSGTVGRRLDAPADVYAAIRGLREQRQGRGEPGESQGGCLVYLTGHGTRAGLSMPLGAASVPAASERRRYAVLKPRDLDAALRQGCGEAPTIVVASACYSGVYLGRAAGLRDAGRIVLTAAARDRTSFGCGDDETHTYYDGCFLRSLDELRPVAAAPWRELAARTQACVAGRERALLPGSPPSNPQSFFADGLDGLPLPRPR